MGFSISAQPYHQVSQLLYRRRDTARALSISESLVLVYERRGLLTPIRLPAARSVRHDVAEVAELARKIRTGELEDA